jgi:hypothetical protein
VYICDNGLGGGHVMIEFKGSHFERDVILWPVRWYVAYLITYRLSRASRVWHDAKGRSQSPWACRQRSANHTAPIAPAAHGSVQSGFNELENRLRTARRRPTRET